ncbi:Uncharacterised protein [Bordetella pertussis]|nr:Uncharacterised protein [Bordetella pertussis]
MPKNAVKVSKGSMVAARGQAPARGGPSLASYGQTRCRMS